MSDAKKDRNRFYGRAWQKVRNRVLAGEPKFCYLCNGGRGPIRYDLKYPDPLSPSVDHVIPAKRFDHLPDAERKAAMLDMSNLKPVHKICNDRKSDSDPPPTALKANPGKTDWYGS